MGLRATVQGLRRQGSRPRDPGLNLGLKVWVLKVGVQGLGCRVRSCFSLGS